MIYILCNGKDILTILVLKEYLSQDLARYILDLSKKIYRDELFFSSQDFWIENDFYNWLIHDVVIRKAMRLDMLDAYRNPENYTIFIGITTIIWTSKLQKDSLV